MPHQQTSWVPHGLTPFMFHTGPHPYIFPLNNATCQHVPTNLEELAVEPQTSQAKCQFLHEMALAQEASIHPSHLKILEQNVIKSAGSLVPSLFFQLCSSAQIFHPLGSARGWEHPEIITGFGPPPAGLKLPGSCEAGRSGLRMFRKCLGPQNRTPWHS